MKHSKKKALMIAAALLAAGFLVCIGALAWIRFDMTKLSTVQFTKKTQEVLESFQNIQIKTQACDIQFLPSEDDRCKVVYPEGRNSTCSVFVEADTLVIRQKDTRKWYEYIGFSWDEQKLTVYLPQTEYKEFALETGIGDVEVPMDFTFTEASLSSDSGDFCFGAAVKETLTVETLIGDLKLHHVTAKNIQAQSTSGDIEVVRAVALEQMKLESTSGEIELKHCDAPIMWLKTVSGDVEGSLMTGKVFEIETHSGDVRVPPLGTGGKCRIETVSGDIEIETGN